MAEREVSEFERAVRRAAVVAKVRRIYRRRRMRGLIPAHIIPGRLVR